MHAVHAGQNEAMKYLPFLSSCAKAIAAALLIAGLQACAVNMHHGTQVTEAQAGSFKIGVTTQDEVIAALGKPSWSTVHPSGEKSIAYMSSTSRINPPSFAVLSGAKPSTELTGVETTGFIFDPNSRLLRIIRTPPGNAAHSPQPGASAASSAQP